MARQVRQDLSYFTLDCNIFSKTAELRPLLRKFKADGLAVYIHILCDVYGTGYYFKPDDYEGYLLDIAEDCGISVEKVQLILAFMADRTLLDAFSLNKNTVFTSHGIQKRYSQAMKGRKRSVAEIKGEYWILTDEEERKIDTFYKAYPSADKSEKNEDKSEKNEDKSEIYSTTEQNRTKLNKKEQKSDYQSSKDEAEVEDSELEELEWHKTTLIYHIDSSNLDEGDKERFKSIVSELLMRESVKINGGEVPVLQVLKAFVSLFRNPENLPDLLYSGNKNNAKQKFLYTVAAMYNSGCGF